MNKSIPIGGVKKPSARFIKKITLVCMGWMPKDSAIGIMSGDTTKIAEYKSIMQPTKINNTFSNNKNTYFECIYVCTISVNKVGTFASIK